MELTGRARPISFTAPRSVLTLIIRVLSGDCPLLKPLGQDVQHKRPADGSLVKGLSTKHFGVSAAEG